MVALSASNNRVRKSTLWCALVILTWYRYRQAFAWMIGYMLLASAITHLYPLHGKVNIALEMPLIIITIIIAFIFSYDWNPEWYVSTYPLHLLIRPVKTPALVIVPMTACTITMAIYWLAFEYFVLLPNGASFTFKPLLIALIFTYWHQLNLWLPCDFGLKRFFNVIEFIAVVACLSIYQYISVPILLATELITITVTYPMSVYAISKYRCGERITAPFKLPVIFYRKLIKQYFANKNKAVEWLLWHEEVIPSLSHLDRLSISLLIICICIFITSSFRNIHILIPMSAAPHHHWYVSQYIIKAILFLAEAVVVFAGITNSWSVYRELRPYIARLPITTDQLIQIRVKSEGIHCAIAALLSLAIVLLICILPGIYNEIQKPIGLVFWTIMSPFNRILFIVSLLVIPLYVWLNRVIYQFTAYIQEGVVNIISKTILITFFILFVYLSYAIVAYFRSANIVGFPWIIGIAALVKFVLMIWAITLSIRERIIPLQYQAITAVLWLTAYTGLVFLIAYQFPTISLLYISAFTYLFLPIVRLCLAPIIFAANRNQ